MLSSSSPVIIHLLAAKHLQFFFKLRSIFVVSYFLIYLFMMETVNLSNTSYQDAVNLLNFKPVSIDKKILQILPSLPVEFNMDFSLPLTRLKNFFQSTTSLNALQVTRFDFLEAFSFEADLSCNEDMKLTSTTHDEIINSSEYVAPKTSSWIFSELVQKKSLINAKSSRFCIQSECHFPKKLSLNIQSRKSMETIPIAMKFKESCVHVEPDLPAWRTYRPVLGYKNVIAENIAKESESLTAQYEDYPGNKHEPERRPILIENQPSEEQKEVEEISLRLNETKDSAELQVIKSKKILRRTQAVLMSLPNIGDPNEILRLGDKIFCTPCKLFVLDNLRQWKRRGEGPLEIWRIPDTEVGYLLLWDKHTANLLVLSRLRGKRGVNYLAKTTNSCRWWLYNYADRPEGVQERLACRFKNSEMAAQFLSILSKCLV